MRAFVTGGTGFIGGHPVRRLRRDGHEVRCLVRSPERGEPLRDLGVVLVVGDVTDRRSVEEGIRGCAWVFHLASINTHWEPEQSVYRAVHLEGTRNVIERALDADVAKVIHVSTALVWGRPEEQPFTEESALGPVRFTEYARSKHAADRLAWHLFETRGLPLVIVYPGSVIGPGDIKQTGQHIAQIVAGKMPFSIFADTTITLVHVDDVVEIMVRAAERPGYVGKRLLAGAQRLTVGEMMEMIATAAGTKAPRLRAPEAVVLADSGLVTLVAGLRKKLPFEGISYPSVLTMRAGLSFDGSKAARELGITYTPVRAGIEQEVIEQRAALDARR